MDDEGEMKTEQVPRPTLRRKRDRDALVNRARCAVHRGDEAAWLDCLERLASDYERVVLGGGSVAPNIMAGLFFDFMIGGSVGSALAPTGNARVCVSQVAERMVQAVQRTAIQSHIDMARRACCDSGFESRAFDRAYAQLDSMAERRELDAEWVGLDAASGEAARVTHRL